jgi:hypothetical protein
MRPERHFRSVLALVLASALGGCSGLPGLHTPPPAPRTDNRSDDGDTVAAVFVAGSFQNMQHLAQAAPAEQAEIFAAARDAYDRSPQGSAKLRYALMLAAPGHPARDPALADRLLRELAAQPETLQPIERAVTLVELSQINAELELKAENDKLSQNSEERSERERSAAVQRRLQNEVDENARLRKQLEDAQAKLDAIAHIERNLTQRNAPNSGGQQ